MTKNSDMTFTDRRKGNVCLTHRVAVAMGGMTGTMVLAHDLWGTSVAMACGAAAFVLCLFLKYD